MKYDLKKGISLVLAAMAFAIPFLIPFENLSVEGHRVFAIFLLAIVLWVTEAIPLHATATLIIFLQIIMISDKAMLPVSEGFEAPAYASFYTTLAHPVIILFLGGFFLAQGASKYHMDRNMARVLLKPFGTSPTFIMLGMMLITALFSMFMSNTATTATMMAVVIPVISTLPSGDRMRKGLALSIPFAANIGGIGTPVGTPPNAIALGALAKAGISISFVKWMLMAVPFVVIILLFAWLLLSRLFASSQKEIRLAIESNAEWSPRAVVFYITFAVTVLLWLTEPLHGIKSTIVGFVPVVVLLATGVFTTRDMQSLQWHVLWLVAGGIALGAGVHDTGLDTWLIGLVSWETLTPSLIATVMCITALLMSCVISNSATSNLLIPIGMSLAMSGVVMMSPVMAAIFIAIGASLAMALPISTPPNAIAYSTGTVEAKDMIVTGLAIGLFGWILFTQVAPVVWKALALVPV